jgi:hypothetical protein
VASLQTTSVTRSVVHTPVMPSMLSCSTSSASKLMSSGANRPLPSHFIVYSYQEYEALVLYIESNSHTIFRELDHHRTQSTLAFYHQCPDLSSYHHSLNNRHSDGDDYEKRGFKEKKEGVIIERSELISKTSEESPLTSRERIRDMK